MTSLAPNGGASARLRSLDGLRGIAAIAVVLGHARLVLLEANPSSLYEIPGLHQALQLLGVFGAHAVWLFFVLSGLVLSRMMLRSTNVDYGNYLLGRLVRLYLPVAAGVAFTFVAMLLVTRDRAGFGEWVDNHPNTYTPSSLLYDLTLVSGSSGNLSPLWSLRWEVLFSLVLILYVVVIGKIPPLLGVALAIALCVIGHVSGSPILQFMSMFAIGTALACCWDRLAEFRDRLELRIGTRRVRYFVACVLAVMLTVGLQVLPLLSWIRLPSAAMGAVDMGSSMLGLALCIVLVGLANPLKTIFEIRLIQWLGVISFSIYLVHEPILLALTYLFDAAPLAILGAILLAFPVAQLFYRGVEKPSHTLARRFSRRGIARSVPGAAL